MKRALLAAGAVLLVSAPAFAQSSSVTIEKRSYSTSTSTVPEVGSTTSTVVIAPQAPPPPKVVTPPPPPGPGVAWIPGHWMWRPAQATFVWINGRYAEPPHVHAAWVPGRWAQRPQGWVWVGGHWD